MENIAPVPNALPPGTKQLDAVKRVTRAVEDYSYQVMDGRLRTIASDPARIKPNKFAAASGAFHGRSARPADLRLVSAGQFLCTAHVCFWGKADMAYCSANAFDPKRTCVGNSLWVQRAMSGTGLLLN